MSHSSGPSLSGWAQWHTFVNAVLCRLPFRFKFWLLYRWTAPIAEPVLFFLFPICSTLFPTLNLCTKYFNWDSFSEPLANATLVAVCVSIVPLNQEKKMLMTFVASFAFISYNRELKEEPPRTSKKVSLLKQSFWSSKDRLPELGYPSWGCLSFVLRQSVTL